MLLKLWNTALVKRSDDVTRLQALVNRKKIVILEDVIREILQLDDAKGESIAEDIANEAIPSTPTPLILPSPPSHGIPSPSQNLEHDKAALKLEIIKLKARVKRLERANKERMVDDLDKDERIELVVDQVKDADIAETKPMKKKDQIELDAEYARKLHEEINKDHKEINKDID
nr:hypothetical protein [Tanacetum cinerariifolium]